MATLLQAKQSKADNLIFLRIMGATLLVMLFFLAWAHSYSEQPAVLRYCAEPQQTLMYLKQVLQKPRPAGDGSRRPYLIAAKLLYLLPRKPQEAESAYLARVQRLIEDTCQ